MLSKPVGSCKGLEGKPERLGNVWKRKCLTSTLVTARHLWLVFWRCLGDDAAFLETKPPYRQPIDSAFVPPSLSTGRFINDLHPLTVKSEVMHQRLRKSLAILRDWKFCVAFSGSAIPSEKGSMNRSWCLSRLCFESFIRLSASAIIGAGHH